MVGIKDVAKAAGVSPSTVSNVLNGKTNVGTETKDRILQICKEMDYHPNLAGKALKSGSNKTILFNFSDFDRQFYLKIIQGINDYAYAKDYDLMICTNRGLDKFMDKGVSCGCIMLDGKCEDRILLEKAANGYQIIALDRLIERPNIKSVVVNNYTPMREMMQGLVDRGYKRFAYINGMQSADNNERYQAFKDVLEENGIKVKREHNLMGDYREKSGYQAAKLLMLSENVPEVLVCANDNMAIGAIRAFQEDGFRVPEDIAVTGFDDTEMAQNIGLTTVSIPNYERGYLAAQYLIENIHGAEDFETFKISARVRWRKTTR